MSSGPSKRISREDIQLVQNLIERCLQLYMNQKDVMETLLHQAKIEPDFTELVWQKLEEENHEFFKAYYARLMVKQQIMEFNRLLEQQLQLMRQMHQNGVASMATSNGSTLPVPQNSVCYATEQSLPTVKLEDTPQAIGSSISSAINGGSALQTNIQSPIEMSARSNRLCPQPNVLPAQNSTFGVMQGINGGRNSEPGYAGNSAYMFGADGGFLDSRSAIGSTTVAPFTSVEPSSHPPNEPLMDPGHSSLGFLSQIPRNFSLSDLTVDFSQDILDQYARSSPFLGRDSNNILEARDHQGDAVGSSCLPVLRRNC